MSTIKKKIMTRTITLDIQMYPADLQYCDTNKYTSKCAALPITILSTL